MAAELLARTTVHKGRIIEVDIDVVRLPTGHTVDMEIVRHPGSVVLVPITASGEVILVRQYRHAIGRPAWELPAGTLKPNEDPKRAAARECHEEIGLLPGQLEELGSFFPTPGYCDEEMTFYRATGLREPGPGDEKAEQDEDEDIEKEAFSLERIRSMIRAGEIIDMKTVAGVSLL